MGVTYKSLKVFPKVAGLCLIYTAWHDVLDTSNTYEIAVNIVLVVYYYCMGSVFGRCNIVQR